MFPIYVTTGGSLYVEILNSVAAITQSGTYASLLAFALTLAIAGWVIYVAFDGHLMKVLEWFLVITIFYGLALQVPVSVTVYDTSNSSLPSGAVNNVPFGLGVPLSAVTTVRYKVTQLFESSMSLPDDMTYSKNGVLFGANLFVQAQMVQIPSGTFAQNVSSYVKQCVLPDIAMGNISPDDLTSTDDIWTFVTSTYPPNPGLSMDYLDSGDTNIITCAQGAASLNQLWPNQMTTGIQRFASRMFPSFSASQANAMLLSSLPAAESYLVGVSKSASDALKQAMMMNIMENAVGSSAAEAGNAAALQEYVNTRTTMGTIQQNMASGAAAVTWLPLVQMTLDLCMIGMFLLTGAYAFLLGKESLIKVVKNYGMGMVGLITWGPLCAIIHRISMGDAAMRTAAGAINIDGAVGVTMATAVGLAKTNIEIIATANYLYALVPMLSGFVVGQSLFGVGSQLLGSSQRQAMQTATEVAGGNMSVGNTSFDNASSHNVSEYQQLYDGSLRSGSISMEMPNGSIVRTTADGKQHLDATGAQSILNTNVDIASGLTRELTNTESTELGFAREASTKLSDSKASTLAQTAEFVANNIHGSANRSATRDVFSADQVRALDHVKEVQSQFAKDNNISEDTAAQILARASAGAKTPDLSPFVASFITEGQLASTGKREEVVKNALNVTQGTHYRDSLSTTEQAFREHGHELHDTNELNFSNRLNSAFDTQKRLEHDVSAHLSNAERASSAKADITRQGVNVNQDYRQRLYDWARARKNPLTNSPYGSEVDQIFSDSSPDQLKLQRELTDAFVQEEVGRVLGPSQQMGARQIEDQYNDAKKDIDTHGLSIGPNSSAVEDKAKHLGVNVGELPTKDVGEQPDIDRVAKSINTGEATVSDDYKKISDTYDQIKDKAAVQIVADHLIGRDNTQPTIKTGGEKIGKGTNLLNHAHSADGQSHILDKLAKVGGDFNEPEKAGQNYHGDPIEQERREGRDRPSVGYGPSKPGLSDNNMPNANHTYNQLADGLGPAVMGGGDASARQQPPAYQPNDA
ncbi:conjugal transfer protein TraG N-terminal domain-containing protein, partial [Nitrospirillum amazonense]|uniref:conjugal transfer protein TraG N-terminal domain-containing protein n=1 Tax=Nitrospirillum amazonense TaxID=28077 RepID=UPI00241280F0